MKKILTIFAAAILAVGMYAGDFGMKIGGTYYPGTLNPTPGDPSFTEYMVLGVSVEAGVTLQLWDAEHNAGWAVDLDKASVSGINRDGDHYACTVAGCYDFYIKIKHNADQLYIGSCSDEPGGGDNPGGGGDINPGSGNYDYYIRGYFDGEDTTTPELDHLFEDGILSLQFSGDGGKGYFYVMVCEYAQVVGRDYMLKEYKDGGTHVTLYDKETTGCAQKWGVPEGTVTFYLYDNGDGTLELSIEPLPGKTLVGGGDQAIEQTPVSEKAYKAIIDGQLRIFRGDKVFDATGRQL